MVGVCEPDLNRGISMDFNDVGGIYIQLIYNEVRAPIYQHICQGQEPSLQEGIHYVNNTCSFVRHTSQDSLIMKWLQLSNHENDIDIRRLLAGIE